MLGQAHGAEAGIENLAGGNPSSEEMATISFRQIETAFTRDCRPFGE